VITSDICVCMAAEREAVAAGTQRLLLLTTRTADWFEQRGFEPAGAAHLSDLLPVSRRIKVCSSGSACTSTSCCL
jgi:N-acetylglutamate synthase-like GNAT family acetyltransferase